MNFIIQLVIAVVMIAISAFLVPRPKTPKPETKDLENPTADAGKEIQLIVGSVTVSSTNVLFFSEKGSRSREVKA